MNPRYKRALVLAVALLAVLPACASDPASDPASEAPEELEKVRFLPGFVISGLQSPWVIGQEKGFFEEEGIELELVPGESPAVALAGLQAGEGEFASVDPIGLALAKKEDPSLDVGLVASTYASSPFAIFSMKGKGDVDEVADLQGKTVHYVAGTIHSTLFPIWLEEHGVDDVTFEEVDPVSREQLLLADEISILTGFITQQAALRPAAEKNGDELLVVEANDEGMSDLYGSGVAARRSWIEDNEDLARGFLRAYVRSFAYAFDNPEETAEVMNEHHPEIPAESTVATIGILERLMTRDGTVEELGSIDPSKIEHTMEYLGPALGLDDVDPSSLYLEGYTP